MWTRWRLATAPRASLRARSALHLHPFNIRALAPHARALSTSQSPVEATESPFSGDDDQLRARRCLHDLSRALRGARTAKQLTTMWAILSRREPVVVDGGFLRTLGAPLHARDETTRDRVVEIPAESLAVRMVALPEMVEIMRRGQRDSVVEHATPFATSPGFLHAAKYDENDREDDKTVEAASESARLPVPGDLILPLSERFVARKIVWAIHRLGCHLELTQFFEAFEAERAAFFVETLLNDDDGDHHNTVAIATELTTLGHHIDGLYLASLGQLGHNAKLLARFEQGGGDLSRYVANRDAFRSLLTACMMERDGALARRILDQALDGGPTFNVKPFTLALHANLRGATKTLDGLHNAMHIYRRMFHEVGYILAPPEWSMLLNACVYLGQHELAMEVFRDYRAHGIAPFQKRFQQALRTACRSAQYATALEMARTWIEVEGREKQQRRVRKAEAECFNKILWEMLKGAPARDDVERVLELMQARGFHGGALVVRRVVAHFFATASDDDELAPEAVLYRFLDLWERVPTAIQRTSFVLHLVLEECEAREWSDQCERVIAYALDKQIELPIASTTKLMDRYASRGQFDEAIQLGELVLQPRLGKLQHKEANSQALDRKTKTKRPRQAEVGIPDTFFESLLRCYLFRERFEDVLRVDDAFQLMARRGGANAALATILRDARAMTY